MGGIGVGLGLGPAGRQPDQRPEHRASEAEDHTRANDPGRDRHYPIFFEAVIRPTIATPPPTRVVMPMISSTSWA